MTQEQIQEVKLEVPLSNLEMSSFFVQQHERAYKAPEEERGKALDRMMSYTTLGGLTLRDMFNAATQATGEPEKPVPAPAIVITGTPDGTISHIMIRREEPLDPKLSARSQQVSKNMPYGRWSNDSSFTRGAIR